MDNATFLIIMLIAIFWVLPSALVSLVGENRNIGTFAVFMISLIFSPIIGLLVGLLSDKKKVIYNCTFCGSEKLPTDIFCQACGKDKNGITKEQYKSRSEEKTNHTI